MRIPGINRVRSKGRLYLYDRQTGTRLRSSPDDPVAIARELAEIRGSGAQAETRDGTLGGLIAAYRKSPEFTGLADRTRDDYEKVFSYLKPLAGMAVERFNRPSFIIATRDRAFRKRKRRFANYVVQVSSVLLGWGKPREWCEMNGAADVPLLRRPKSMGRANRPWTEKERAVVLERAPAQLRVPIAIGIYAAPREADALRMPRSADNGAEINWTAGKNRRELHLRVHPKLREILDAAPKSATIFCLNSRGKPWTQSGFRASFFKFIRQLEAEGVVGPGLTFHALRHTLGDELADAGCDTRAIAAVLGITEKQAEHYSKGADQRRRAKAALIKLERKRK